MGAGAEGGKYPGAVNLSACNTDPVVGLPAKNDYDAVASEG